MPDSYEIDYTIGQDNIKKWGMDIHNPVFWISSVLVVIFVLFAILFPEFANKTFENVKTWCINKFDWFFLISGNLVLLFSIALALSPFGKIRIGGAQAKPEFKTLAWFAMLFAAGMGIGLMFWGVAEPIAYYTDWYGTPLGVQPRTPEAATMAMAGTLFHWGFHPWSIYAVVGLSLAFFRFNKQLPLTIRSGLYPLIKGHSWGRLGNFIDIVAVIATIFGLATSLGFGAKQAAAGIAHVFGFSSGVELQIGIIIVVTFFATISVVRGLKKGVQVLSNINIVMAFLLMLFVFFAGPTMHIVKTFFDTGYAYMANIISFSSHIDRTDTNFVHGWTVFYWAWWISWSPFVGMFIARISKGRTVRQFMMAVLFVPTLVTLAWMSVFGGTALHQAQNGTSTLANGFSAMELALFEMLGGLPFSSFVSILSILVILCFFVTSSDSGSLVIDSITAGGKLDAPVPQRIFWAVMEGLIAIALLVGGGSKALGALQAAAISVGLPFTLVVIALCISLWMGLSHEKKHVLSILQKEKN